MPRAQPRGGIGGEGGAQCRRQVARHAPQPHTHARVVPDPVPRAAPIQQVVPHAPGLPRHILKRQPRAQHHGHLYQRLDEGMHHLQRGDAHGARARCVQQLAEVLAVGMAAILRRQVLHEEHQEAHAAQRIHAGGHRDPQRVDVVGHPCRRDAFPAWRDQAQRAPGPILHLGDDAAGHTARQARRNARQQADTATDAGAPGGGRHAGQVDRHRQGGQQAACQPRVRRELAAHQGLDGPAPQAHPAHDHHARCRQRRGPPCRTRAVRLRDEERPHQGLRALAGRLDRQFAQRGLHPGTHAACRRPTRPDAHALHVGRPERLVHHARPGMNAHHGGIGLRIVGVVAPALGVT